LIAYPELIAYKVVKELFLNKASEIRATVSESHKKNPTRKLPNMFPEINFITYQYNKVLMYPNTLAETSQMTKATQHQERRNAGDAYLRMG